MNENKNDIHSNLGCIPLNANILETTVARIRKRQNSDCTVGVANKDRQEH